MILVFFPLQSVERYFYVELLTIISLHLERSFAKVWSFIMRVVFVTFLNGGLFQNLDHSYIVK